MYEKKLYCIDTFKYIKNMEISKIDFPPKHNFLKQALYKICSFFSQERSLLNVQYYSKQQFGPYRYIPMH